jgi:hypothetical protein
LQQIEILFFLQQTDSSRIKKRHNMPACPSEHSPATHFPKHTTSPELAQFGNLLQTRTHHNQTPPITVGLKLGDSPTHTQKFLPGARKQIHRNLRQSDPSRTPRGHRPLHHDDVTLTYVPITSSTQNPSPLYSPPVLPIRPGRRCPPIQLGSPGSSLHGLPPHRLRPCCFSTVHQSCPVAHFFVDRFCFFFVSFFFFVFFFSLFFFYVFVSFVSCSCLIFSLFIVYSVFFIFYLLRRRNDSANAEFDLQKRPSEIAIREHNVL